MARQRAAVELEGGPQLRRAFDKMEDRAADLRQPAREAAETVEHEAESLVPVLTGRLRESIRSTVSRNRSAVIAGNNRLVPYAGPIHFGWRDRNIEPHPFLYDALDRRRDEVVERYRAHVETLVLRFEREAPHVR